MLPNRSVEVNLCHKERLASANRLYLGIVLCYCSLGGENFSF